MLYIQCTFFARIFEHAMTTLINTYFNTEFRINLQDLHSSTRLNADLSLNHFFKFLILQIHALTLKIHFLNIISNIITEILNIRKYCFFFLVSRIHF